PNYRVYFGYYLTYLENLDSRIHQIEKTNDRWFHQLSFLTAIKFDAESNGEIFFRSRLSMSFNKKEDIFFQTQIGYSFKVFTKKPDTRKRSLFYDVF
ncbi:MAG: hypothetical protein L6Q97_27000, partial [Thermoanaerobaculia bacterium]|nr:hypothetical protein [Thermoanaerobaculia bacterium]